MGPASIASLLICELLIHRFPYSDRRQSTAVTFQRHNSGSASSEDRPANTVESDPEAILRRPTKSYLSRTSTMPRSRGATITT